MQESSRLFRTGRNDLLTMNADDAQDIGKQLVKELAILVVLSWSNQLVDSLTGTCSRQIITDSLWLESYRLAVDFFDVELLDTAAGKMAVE